MICIPLDLKFNGGSRWMPLFPRVNTVSAMSGRAPSWSATGLTPWWSLDAITIDFTGLISYQFDHLMRPQICFLPKGGKPLVLVYGNERAKAKTLPWIGEVRSYVD